jgi:hypothetical protein
LPQGGGRCNEGEEKKLRRGEVEAEDEGNTTAGADGEEDGGRGAELFTPLGANLRKGLMSGMRNLMT